MSEKSLKGLLIDDILNLKYRLKEELLIDSEIPIFLRNKINLLDWEEQSEKIYYLLGRISKELAEKYKPFLLLDYNYKQHDTINEMRIAKNSYIEKYVL